MKKYFFLCSSLFASLLTAKPVVTIDFVRVTERLGVIAGTAKGDVPGPVYVTVKNADLPYTTLADPQGNWAVTFRYFSTRVTAEGWQSDNSNSTEPMIREIRKEEIE